MSGTDVDQNQFEDLSSSFFISVEEALQKLSDIKAGDVDQKQFQNGVKTIFGWLILLCVRVEGGESASLRLPTENVRFEFKAPVDSAACVEIVTSRFSQTPARFELDGDDEVIGGALIHDFPETGPSGEGILLSLKQAIWKVVYHKSAPTPFGKKETIRLDGKLKGRKKRNENYYVPIHMGEKDNPLNNPEIYNTLCQELKHLNLVFIGSEEGKNVLLTTEPYLVGHIEDFLKLFEEEEKAHA